MCFKINCVYLWSRLPSGSELLGEESTSKEFVHACAHHFVLFCLCPVLSLSYFVKIGGDTGNIRRLESMTSCT